MTVGSLFAGIGGFDLGFQRAGYDIAWQVEIDAYATRVLHKHWPHVPRYGDIRAIDWSAVEPVDVVCGGFPCQPHSVAGRRQASADDRDLWPEVVRCLREVRPRWFVGENVPGLLSSESGRFFGTVLRDLAACGFDVEWDCLPASAVGAPHRRDRVWIVAHAHGIGSDAGRQRAWLDSEWRGHHAEECREDVADTHSQRLEGRTRIVMRECASERIIGARRASELAGHQWEPEPNVGRVADGVPNRVDRLRGLGNAIVPQIAEWIARRITEAEA